MYSIIRKDGTEYGPVSVEMLKDWLGSNLLDAQTKIRRDSETEWTTIGALPELAEHLPPPLPSVPSPKPYSLPSNQPAAVTSHSPDLLLIRTPERPNIALKILIGVVSSMLGLFCVSSILILGFMISGISDAREFGDSAVATAVAIISFTAVFPRRNLINLYRLMMGAALLSGLCAGVILFAHFGSEVGYSHRALMGGNFSLHYMIFVGCTLGFPILPIVMLIRMRLGQANKNNPPDDQSTEADEDVLLASRWQRLGASLIDGLIIYVPAYFCTGGLDPHTHTLNISAITGFVALLFIVFNGMLLHQSGQTIGKRIIGIQIVDLNGDLPSVQKHLFPRYAFYLLVGIIPVAGPFISLINILFIFGDKKRCLHDILAGTKVISKS